MSAASVQTALGPVPTDELGWVLPHEHLVMSSAGIWDVYPELLGDRLQLEAEAVSSLSALTGTPFRTIVDLTTHDLGRNVGFIQRMSAETGVHVVLATGCWMDPPRSFYRREPEQVAASFAKDLERGFEGTPIRAGVIKAASDGPISPEFARIFVAAGIASAQTGAPVYTHSSPATHDGFAQLELIVSGGGDPARVCIGHSNDTIDVPYLVELAAAGCYLGLDRIPGEAGPPLEDRIELILELVSRGLTSQLLISHDWGVAFSHSVEPRRGLDRAAKSFRLINDRVIPDLRRMGVSEDDLETMFKTNPQRFLTGAEA